MSDEITLGLAVVVGAVVAVLVLALRARRRRRPTDDLGRRLRTAAGALTRWTFSVVGLDEDVPDEELPELLREAADRIDLEDDRPPEEATAALVAAARWAYHTERATAIRSFNPGGLRRRETWREAYWEAESPGSYDVFGPSGMTCVVDVQKGPER